MQKLILWLKSKSLMLAIGSAFASGLNFYSYVVLPAYRGTASLDAFVRENYLGGLYLFGVASSVAPVTMYIFASGKFLTLSRYARLSFLALACIGLGGASIAKIPWSYACLFAAVCMHSAGLFQASLLQQERAFTASVLMVIQPVFFAALISAYEFGYVKGLSWSSSYFISCFTCMLIFAFYTDWSWFKSKLSEKPSVSTSYKSIVLRMAMSVSFPLFFQLELILFGLFTSADLGEYAILQKLYSSISVSLFSSIGILMLSRSLNNKHQQSPTINKQVIAMAAAATLCVLPVGFLVNTMGQNVNLSFLSIALSGAIAFLFTIGSFINLKLSTTDPTEAIKLLVVSLLFYGLLFIAIPPLSVTAYLAHAGLFFLVYLLLFHVRQRVFKSIS